jgi:hypothetical protein
MRLGSFKTVKSHVSIDRCEDTTECWPSVCKADFVWILHYVPRYKITLFHFAVVQCLLCWYLQLVVVEELEYPSNPESYAVGSLATGRATLGGQVEG